MIGGAWRYVGLLTALACALCWAQPVAAHILITPATSVPGSAQLYTITVPGERAVPTTRVEIRVPPGVIVAGFAASPGWQRQISVNGAGTVTAITWSGGLILPEEYAQFGIYARNPARRGTLAWPAYQTYQDGFPVAWTGAPNSLRPAPTTELSGAAPEGVTVAVASSDGGIVADVALAISLLSLGLAALCLGLLILSLRRRIL